MLTIIEYCLLSSQPVDSRADTIRIIPINRKKTLHGVISDSKRITRFDIARGITETTQSNVAKRVEEELKGRAPNATQDINDLKDTVRHLGDIIAKNTGQRILAKTNEQDKIDSDEDHGILGSFVPPVSPNAKDIFSTYMIYSTKPDGEQWDSSNWNNRSQRTLTHNMTDPNDVRLLYTVGTPNTVTANIDGDSHAKFTEFSDIKIFDIAKGVTTDWKNVEMSMWVKRELEDPDDNSKSVAMVVRSNYLKRYPGETPDDCGFGGYFVYWWNGTATLGVNPLEPISKDVVSRPWEISSFEHNVWQGYKLVVRDNLVDNTVKLEAWSCNLINSRADPDCWNKDVEFTFTGTNVDIDPTGNEARVTACTNKGSQTANDLDGVGTRFINRGGHDCEIDLYAFTKVRVKWVSLREIVPISPP